MNYLTSQEAAEKLGISVRRLQALVKSERLPATRFGRALMIKESDLRLVENRKPGRPPKTAKAAKKAKSKQ